MYMYTCSRVRELWFISFILYMYIREIVWFSPSYKSWGKALLCMCLEGSIVMKECRVNRKSLLMFMYILIYFLRC